MLFGNPFSIICKFIPYPQLEVKEREHSEWLKVECNYCCMLFFMHDGYIVGHTAGMRRVRHTLHLIVIYHN